MSIDDPLLPAARELCGPDAIEVLRPAVVAAGGTVHDASCTQVHYRPGHELVARYDCDVTWPSGRVPEVLLAATTTGGGLPGTVAVTASTPTATLDACVWRWPFDPVLTGLVVATSPGELGRRLGDIVTGPLRVEVVAYHPTQRAVARVVDADGRVSYLKVLPPAHVRNVAARHEALRSVGVGAPDVLHVDDTAGFLLLGAMSGATLRDHIRSGRDCWPDPDALAELLRRLDSVPVPQAGPARASRTRDALAHAGFLRTVAPPLAERLAVLEARFRAALPEVEARSGTVVHGDLHEAQLFVDVTGAITGIIDLDDLGLGDPLDDPAVLLGHLEYRALTSDRSTAERLHRPIASLRERFAALQGPEALDLTVAAVLTGLATGPFRSRVRDWPDLTASVLEVAERRAAGDWTPVVRPIET